MLSRFAPQRMRPGFCPAVWLCVPQQLVFTGTAVVYVGAKYAAIQEFGGKTWPTHHKYMHWVNSGGFWYKKEVTIPPHPYFRPTVDRMVRNGDLTREAKVAFWARVLPYFQG